MATSERIPWIDNAKAVGIVLVVLGHAPALPEGAREFIYRFHMPLFFLLAGAVVKPERMAGGFIPWVARQARGLLGPYLFFWAVSTAWWLMIRNIGEKARESAGLAWWWPVKGLWWGTGEALFVNPPLWFFPAMFVTTVAAWGVWWLTRWDRRLLVIWLVILTVVAPAWSWVSSLVAGWTTCWNIDLLPWMLFYFLLGSLVGPGVPRISKTRWWWMCGPGCLLGLALLSPWLPPFDLNGRLLWPWLGGRIFRGMPSSSALVFTAAFAASLAATTGRFGEIRALSRLARETIIIFPLHGLCFSVFTGVLSVAMHAGGWSRTGGWAAALAYTVGALVLCLAGAPLLRRWVPWAVGQGRKRAP